MVSSGILALRVGHLGIFALRGQHHLLLCGRRVQEHAAQLAERVRARAAHLLGRLGALEHLQSHAGT